MRTLMLILAGLALMALATWIAKPAQRMRVAMGFTVAWLLVVLWNLRTGMSHGYSLAEEAPIQALIFLVPVAAAWLLAWKGRGR